MELIVLALDICQQVEVYESDNKTVVGQKTAFQKEVTLILKNHRSELTFEEEAIHFDKADTDFRGFIGAVKKLHTAAKKQNKDNTGKWGAAVRFMGRGGWGNKKTQLHGISLYAYQNNKSDGGHVYGMRFGKEAYADIDMDLDNDYNKLPGKSKQPDSAYAVLNAASIPVESLHYISANMTTHMSGAQFDNVNLEMTWPSKKTSPVELEKETLVEGKINLTDTDITINGLRYLARSYNKAKKRDEQYTVAIGSLVVKGISAKNLSVINTRHSFKNNQEVMYQLIDGTMASFYLIIDAVMAAVMQMMSVGESFDFENLEGFQKDIVKTLTGKTSFTIDFKQLDMKNLVHSDNGVIEDIHVGATTITLSDRSHKEPTIEDLNWEKHPNKDRVQLALHKEDLAKLRVKMTKLEAKDKTDKKRYQDLKKEATDLSNKIKDLEEGLEDIMFPIKYDLKIKTEEEITLSNGKLVEDLIKEQFKEELADFGLTDIAGLENYSIPEGMTLNSTVSGDGIEGTVLNVDKVGISKISDSEMFVEMGDMILTGSNMVGTNLVGNAKIDWTDVKRQEADEVVKFHFLELALTEGDITLDHFILSDGKHTDIKIAGKTTLKNIYLNFHDLAGSDFTNLTFGCTEIVIHDIAEYEVAVGKNKALGGWFKEYKNSKVVLNGFSVRNNAVEEIPVAGKDEVFFQKIIELKVMSGDVDSFKAADVKLNTSLTYLNTTITSRTFHDVTTHEDGTKTTKENGNSETEYHVQFGLSEVDIPYVSFENDDYAIAHFNFNEAGLKRYVEYLKKDNENTRVWLKDVIAHPTSIYYYYEQQQADIIRGNKILAANNLELDRYSRTTDTDTRTKLTGINVDATILQTTQKIEATGEEAKEGDVEAPTSKTTTVTTINGLYVDEILTNNLKIREKKTGSETRLNGHSKIECFAITDAVLKDDGADLNIGGLISGDSISAAWLVTKGLEIDEFSTGRFEFEKLEDGQGYRYSVDDLKGDYNVSSGKAIGDLNLSFSGTYNFDEKKNRRTISFSTGDRVDVPTIAMKDFSIEHPNGGIGLSGISMLIDIQYKGTGDARKIQYVMVRNLDVGRVDITGTTIKAGETEVVVAPDRKLWLEGLKLTDMKYDKNKKGLEAITGKATTKGFDFSQMDKLHLDGSKGTILELFKGGVKGEGLSFERLKDGEMIVEVTSPELLMLAIKQDGINVEAADGKGFQQLFKAGSLTYRNTPEGGKGDLDAGHHILIKDAVFNPVELKGTVLKDRMNLELEKAVLSGKVTGDLGVHYTEDYVEVYAIGADVTIEEVNISTEDLAFLKSKEKIAEEQAEKAAYDKMTIKQKSKHDADTKAKGLQDYYQKRREEDGEHYQMAMAQVLGAYGLTFEEYFQLGREAYPLQEIDLQEDLAFVRDKTVVNNLPVPREVVKMQTMEEWETEYYAKVRASDKKSYYNTINSEIHALTEHAISSDFNFLDHMVEGKVMMEVFGEDVMFSSYRVQPPSISTRYYSVYPWDESVEKNSGGGFATFVDVKKFFWDLSWTLGRHVDSGSWLSDALTDGELFVHEGDTDLELYAQEYSDIYLLTMLKNMNPSNYTQIGVNHYVRLSAMLSTLAYDQDDESLLVDNGAADSFWYTAFVVFAMMKGISIPAIIEGAKQSVLTDLKKYMHRFKDEMNPRFKVLNAKFDLKGKTDIQKGLLSFVHPEEGEKALGLTMRMGLNQNRRSGAMTSKKSTHRRELGPEIELTNFNMPSFTYGNKEDKTKKFIDSDGVSIERLFVRKNQVDLDKLLETKKPYGPSSNVDKGGRLECKNVKIKDFHLRIPLKKKK